MYACVAVGRSIAATGTAVASVEVGEDQVANAHLRLVIDQVPAPFKRA